jgi:hypothetical protein
VINNNKTDNSTIIVNDFNEFYLNIGSNVTKQIPILLIMWMIILLVSILKAYLLPQLPSRKCYKLSIT